MSFEYKTFMIIEENNQNRQDDGKLKAVDYCVQYGRWNKRTVD